MDSRLLGIDVDPHSGFEALQKALAIGDVHPAEIGVSNPAQLMATVPQDLSAFVVDNLPNAQHLKLYNLLTKTKTPSTNHQYATRTSRGGFRRGGGWHAEGGRPAARSTSFKLDEVKVRYVGASCGVTLQAASVQSTIGDVVKAENDQATMNVLEMVEHGLLYGNSAVNPFQIDGVRTQVLARNGNVIDLRGGAPTEDILNQGVVRVGDIGSLGSVTDILCSPNMHETLRTLYFDKMRKDFGSVITPNYELGKVKFQHGPVEIHPSVFMSHEGQTYKGAEGEDLARRPLSPLVTVQPAANNGPLSQFVASDAGTYIYGVQFLNPHGESPMVTTDPVAVAAGQLVTLTVNDQGVGEQRATGVRLFRSTKDGAEATLREMVEVGASGADDGNTVLTDRNDDIPGCQTLIGITNRPTSLSILELLPLFNFPFGRVATSYEWALLYYMALKIALPRHHIVWRNVRPSLLAA